MNEPSARDWALLADIFSAFGIDSFQYIPGDKNGGAFSRVIPVHLKRCGQTTYTMAVGIHHRTREALIRSGYLEVMPDPDFPPSMAVYRYRLGEETVRWLHPRTDRSTLTPMREFRAWVQEQEKP